MIPDIKELNFPKKDGKQYATLTQATVTLADMGEKTITSQIKIDGEITPDFSTDWAVEFQGEKYIMPLRQPQGAKENTSLNSTIDLTFHHWAIYQLKRWMFFTVQPVETGTAVADKYIADVQLNLKDFCDLLSQVLHHHYGDTITIDLNLDWGYKTEPTPISISHSYIWDVLIKLYELFAVRWQIEPHSTNNNDVEGGERYTIKVGYPTTEVDHIFEYGFEGGLLKVERQVQNEDIRNMILGRGGEKNMPLRYFKDVDPDNPDFRGDPDWVEELANIYFTNLHGATFRSYIQGWKAAHIAKYPGYTAIGESNAYAPWAYRKGYTDTKFEPVEYVKDDASIAKYGPLLGGLDNNEEIYPTIQGSGMDIAIDVEQITSDDVAESVASDAVESSFKDEDKPKKTVELEANGRKSVEMKSGNFHVASGKHANLDEGPKTFKISKEGKRVGVSVKNGKVTIGPQTFQIEVEDYIVDVENISLAVVNVVTGEELPASGIPAGTYYFRISMSLHNTSKDKLKVTVSCGSPKLTSATLDDNSWKNTFDIWVKNIWETVKGSTETNTQYAERVWNPILGDREKNTAKVMFTSGALAVSEDYDFTIVELPTYDTSKNLNGNASHWRIKLAKSDADLESTGLYVPSTMRQGKAGDTFVFIGTEMTHHYVVWAEKALDNWKKDHLGEVKDIKPSWVVTTDRVRLNNAGASGALIHKLKVGDTLRIADKRFIINEEGSESAYETLYIQSMTCTYREASNNDTAINPDVAIVLSDKYETGANPVSTMQGEISELQRQLGAISNIEQIVRSVGDKLYLRKDGISDRSLSPTKFFSLLTSDDFRAGIVGGAGWGFYKDANGNWVLETDHVNVRQEMSVNTLVINQAEGRGGMEVDTAAFMHVTRVVDTDNGYICYFDQKDGSVANLFHIDDVAFCNQWTPENTELKFYKRRVTAVSIDNITLSKKDVNGTGIPMEKDTIIHFGNYTDEARQYIKVRDIVGGGYERYIEELNSVNADGVEYYFIGKKNGLYGGKPRWFIGSKDGEYAEWVDGKLNIKGAISAQSTIGDKTINEYFTGLIPELKQEDIEEFVNTIVNPKLENIQDQIDGVIETWFSNGIPTMTNYPANGWNTPELKIQHLGDLYYDNTTGTAYRFSQNVQGDYYWNTITDDAITKALAAAKNAQDTADGKRRIFTSQPTPPYDKGDLWVNATYGSQYNNDILRCNTAKTKGASFAISDWGLSSKYTDDTLAQAAKDAANEAQKTADAAKSVADAAKTRLDSWAVDGVISPTEKQGIKEEIARIYGDKVHISEEYTRYDLGKPTAYETAYANYRSQLVILSAATPENIAIPSDFATKQATYYSARTTALSEIAEAAKKYAEVAAKDEAKKAIAGYEYLKKALPDMSTIIGGVFLTSLIRVGQHNADLSTQTVWSGLNGVYTKARDLSYWAGGDALDLFNDNDTRKILPEGARPAAAAVRMDGSAYFAKGNIGFKADGSGWLGNEFTGIKFGSDGSLTLGSGIKIDVSSEAGIETSLSLIADFTTALSYLLVPVDRTGAILQWSDASKNDGAGGIKAKALKSRLDFFSEKGVTALGHSSTSDGGSGGGASALADLLDVSLTSPAADNVLVYDGTHWVNRPMSSVKPDLSAYATQAWVQSRGYITASALVGYATEQWVLGRGYATPADIDARIDALVDGAPAAFDTLKEIADVLQSNVNSIGDLMTALGTKADKATTLAGYGITDSYTATQVNNLLAGYLPLAGGTMANDNLVRNLNAEKINGFTIDGLFRRLENNPNLDALGDINNKNGIFYINPGNETTPFKYGSVLNISTWTASWQIGVDSNASMNPYFRSRWWSENGAAWGAWKRIAFLTDTVEASKCLKSYHAQSVDSFEENGVKHVAQINNGSANLFPASSNANSILSIMRHPTMSDGYLYVSQIGFSSNGRVYYRAGIGNTPWQSIAFITDTVANASKLGGELPSYYATAAALSSLGEKKLDRTVFDDLFEKVNVGTAAAPKYVIRAKYGICSDADLVALNVEN